ncbi:MAG TPA: hypothetical protein VI958_08120, partial [Acidobacteriota bacterium]
LWDGIRWTTIGIAGGIALAFVATRLLAGLLYGISPNDFAAFVASAGLFFLITTAAAYFAARKAASVPPALVLRAE